MKAAERKPEPRGACPGALRPMESGDGLIVRVRPRGGAMPVLDLAALADAADRYGNGEIDLTRRANLQIRGITLSNIDGVLTALDQMGLLDASPEAEAVRNIIVSPLAGLDPAERIDVRPIARELEGRLTSDNRLWSLPAKFGFVIDGGGALSLDDERADIRLRAIDRESFALGLDGGEGIRWLGRIATAQAAEVASEAAALFASSFARGSRIRIRDAASDIVANIVAPLALAPLGESPAPRPQHRPLGRIEMGANGVALALGVPFGRITAATLRALCAEAYTNGVSEMRLSPWRVLYAPVPDETKAGALEAYAEGQGLLVKDGDPISRIDACTGKPACASAFVATRQAARKLAAMASSLGIESAHVSGCAKGCARSAPADLVLIGGEEGFGIVRGGRADDTPEAFVTSTLDDLPARIRDLRHV